MSAVELGEDGSQGDASWIWTLTPPPPGSSWLPSSPSSTGRCLRDSNRSHVAVRRSQSGRRTIGTLLLPSPTTSLMIWGALAVPK